MLEFETAPPGDYIYGGNLISHFGHFLLGFLSRFWIGQHLDLSKHKIICHGAGTPEGWLSHKFVRDILSSIGIDQHNLMVFKRPTIIENLLVPWPSCEEHNYVHTNYASWGNMVGQSLLRNRNLA
ncbi:MAG: hypothetical protein B7Z78_04500 [Rhodospirillales bacterium 20-60-12]|nr:MAG: hypothetical protein B7Z78_04500 [Rhodospirillales bacterium 20-60-12]